MKKTLIRIAVAGLVCLQLVALASCNGEKTPGGDTTPDDSSAPSIGTTTAAQGLSLVENGKSVYKVIRSDKASKTVISAASKLRSALSDAAGVNVGIAEDWVKSVDELDPNAFEILVGPTNREASSVTDTLNPNDYIICLKNNSVVITGGSDKAIVEAVNVFIAQCVGDKQILIGETISHTEALACPDFRVGGTAIGDFVPVYSATVEDEEGKTIASSLGDVLFNLSGASLKAVADTAKSDSAHKIFIGPTNDAYSTSLYSSGFDTFDYRVEVKDGNLYLAGGSCFALQYCVNLLRDEYLSKGLSLDAGLVLTGSAYGKRLYDLEEGADVRIMSNNVWQCDDNKAAWKDIGEDCSAEVRSKGLAAVYMARAEEHQDTILPGCTHLQPAQPVSLAHHLLAYAWMLRRDVQRMADCEKRTRISPLGAAALAGTTYPLDPASVARELDMYGTFDNSMDAVSDRDFVIEALFCASTAMMHLSRCCEEIILWSNPAFGFVKLPDAYATGSSIMPQKKNPDVAELVRGKTGRVYGSLITLLTAMKGLPLAYNKDMQEDKEPVFDAIDTVELCLPVFSAMIDTLTVNRANMRKAANGGFISATDCADYLAKKGMPFREAYGIVGKLVGHCVDTGHSLETLPLEEYKKVSEYFEEDVYDALSLETCVNGRKVYGGPAPEAVKVQIENIKHFIQERA